MQGNNIPTSAQPEINADEGSALLPSSNQPKIDPAVIFFMQSVALTAVMLFADAVMPDSKTPKTSKEKEMIALAALMLSATGLPVLRDIVNYFKELPKNVSQAIETISSVLMAAAVMFMEKGAIENPELKKLISAKLGLTAVTLFSVFASINMTMNLLKSFKIIESDKVIAQLISGSTGFVGSTLFLTVQIMNYMAAKAAGDEKGMQAALKVIGTSILFMIVTGFHTVQATKGLLLQGRSTDNDETERSPLDSHEELPRFGCAAFFKNFLPACCFDSKPQNVSQPGSAA